MILYVLPVWLRRTVVHYRNGSHDMKNKLAEAAPEAFYSDDLIGYKTMYTWYDQRID